MDGKGSLEGFQIEGLGELEDVPGAGGGRAEVVQPIPEPLPNANTVEGAVAGVGIMARGMKRSPRTRPVVYFIALSCVASFVIGAIGIFYQAYLMFR